MTGHFDKTTLQALSAATLRGDVITVQFNKNLDYTEITADIGMKANILSCTPADLSEDLVDNSYKIVFDMSPYEAFNDRFATATYYNPKTNAHDGLAKDTGWYKPQDTWYFGPGNEIPYDIVPTLSLTDKLAATLRDFLNWEEGRDYPNRGACEAAQNLLDEYDAGKV